MVETDAGVAIRAARAASGVLRSYFRGPVVRYDKGDNDFATEADIAAEQSILAVLGTARAGDRFLAEESGRTGGADTDREWLIDPLCGTRNFDAGTPLVAVNIALRIGSSVRTAVMADPFAEEVFWTDGDGAWSRRDGLDLPLAPGARTGLVDVDLDYSSRDPFAFDLARLLGDRAFATAFGARVSSTSLPVAWVAAGRRAAYLTDGDLRDSVHFASGIALCEAAGCVVTGLLGQPWTVPPYGLVAAADAQTHATLIGIIHRLFGDETPGE